jgi:hypothetical protein
MVSFEFKLKMCINQEATHSYGPPALATVSTDRPGPSAGSTDPLGRLVPLQTTRAATSVGPSGTDLAAVDTAGCRWNQPNIGIVYM